MSWWNKRAKSLQQLRNWASADGLWRKTGSWRELGVEPETSTYCGLVRLGRNTQQGCPVPGARLDSLAATRGCPADESRSPPLCLAFLDAAAAESVDKSGSLLHISTWTLIANHCAWTRSDRNSCVARNLISRSLSSLIISIPSDVENHIHLSVPSWHSPHHVRHACVQRHQLEWHDEFEHQCACTRHSEQTSRCLLTRQTRGHLVTTEANTPFSPIRSTTSVRRVPLPLQLFDASRKLLQSGPFLLAFSFLVLHRLKTSPVLAFQCLDQCLVTGQVIAPLAPRHSAPLAAATGFPARWTTAFVSRRLLGSSGLFLLRQGRRTLAAGPVLAFLEVPPQAVLPFEAGPAPFSRAPLVWAKVLLLGSRVVFRFLVPV